MRRLIVAALVVSAFSACSKGASTPTSPSAPSGGGTTKIIALSGSLGFGDVALGSTRATTLTISNSGTAMLSFTGLTISGGIVSNFSATPTSGSVPAGGSMAVTIRFTPQSGGTFSGTLSVTSDHTSGTNTTPISGTGVAPPVTLMGVITNANTRAAVGGVRVAVSASGQPVGSATTDGNGYYSLVVPSATALSISLDRSGYNPSTSTATFTGDTRRDATIVPFWRHEGVGNTVFDMPTSVRRVRITGVYNAGGSNFIVKIGGRLAVNEIIGTRYESGPRYEGLHATTGGQVEITNSRDVIWTFVQEQ